MKYAVLSFSREGYFRGFASGYLKQGAQEIVLEESERKLLSIIISDEAFIKKMPRKYLESHYWKFSTDANDMINILNAVL